MAISSNNIQGMEDLVKYIYGRDIGKLHIFMGSRLLTLRKTGWQVSTDGG